MKTTKRSLSYWLLYLAMPVLVLIIWQGLAVAGIIKPYTMPAPSAIVKAAIQYGESGKLAAYIGISVLRVIEGFLAGLVVAFILGIASGLSRRVEIFTDFCLQILRPIPPIAWIPLAILWFGIGELSKIYIIFVGAFFPVFVTIVDGIKAIDKKYYELAQVYEVPKKQFILHIIIPGALPAIMTGIRVGMGNAWVCVVAAEMIGATKGVGFMLMDGRSLSRPDIVILGMLLVGCIGKIMDDVLLYIRRRVVVR
ncbi:ABC transporter permease [uncultured Megasphaera sp.]|uniref:ABC transporter permease n=1 Tax=uncultured Megasphaera sp. TaxID=165188 RepID=UPI0026593F43|nr:ABC transporter permease [uncultured Megasphaera sp.]